MSKSVPTTENYTNKVFQTLACLDKSSLKRLGKYLQSPYFVQSDSILILFRELCVCLNKSHAGFDRQKIWQSMFPGQDYDDTNFRKYCSELLRYTQDFMAFETIASNPSKRMIATHEFVVEHKISPLYNSSIRDARNFLEKDDYRSLSHFRSKYQLERQYYSMMEFDVKVDTSANLEEISSNLDLFYWIEKLKISSSAISQKKTGTRQYKIEFVDEVRKFLQTYKVEEVPELAIYYHSFLTLYEEDNVEHYYNLKRLLQEYGNNMPQKEAIELTDSALHYCTGKMNKGQREFLQEYFDLFENMLNKGLFFQKGILATWRFNNMVGVALQMKKLDWAENFIHQNQGFLSADTRENTYIFNLARVYRYKGEYDKVLKLLINVEYEDIGYNLISKAMLLITYYELDEFDTLFSFTNAFKTFLNRHKNIPPGPRQGYSNLIKFTRQLIRLNHHDKKAKEALREQISKNKAVVFNHEWLLEKLR